MRFEILTTVTMDIKVTNSSKKPAACIFRDSGNRFLQNVGNIVPDYIITSQDTAIFTVTIQLSYTVHKTVTGPGYYLKLLTNKNYCLSSKLR